MKNAFVRAIVAATLIAVPATSYAASQCRDSHGKFIKCPEKRVAPAKKCKDSAGKFAKCGTPGAKPV